jgi:hypothetical protein
MKTNFTPHAVAVALLAAMLFAVGCKEPVPPSVPIVVIKEDMVAAGYDMAVLYAEVVDDGRAIIKERGFCYKKEGGQMDTLLCDAESGAFSIELHRLSMSTNYVCQAFAGNEAGRGYSDMFRFTTLDDTVPHVKTWYVKEITCYSAVVSGQVFSSGGQEVLERGVCYGYEPDPAPTGLHVAAGSGLGPFDCQLTDLLPDTAYYYRAYAVCTKGVYYGEQTWFRTDVLPMEVHTGRVSDVTATRVFAEGEVTRDGGNEVTECGFCWSTQHNPTINGMHYKVDAGVGAFGGYFSGFERGRTYYMRAYAINEKGPVYGEEVEFVPNDNSAIWSTGALPGLFSISPDRQVRFSQGNLQFCPNVNAWRFAERQWDFVGGNSYCEGIGDMEIGTVYADGVKSDNSMIWAYYEGWIDLFGWGTSGWNNGNTYFHPYDHAANTYDCASYGPPGNYDLTGDYAHADWGVHNAIGIRDTRQWRTLTAEEFLYVLNERHTPSHIRFAHAMVAGVRGLVVLPDDWSESIYYLNGTNEFNYYSINTIPGRDWLEVLEPAGAVFLPAAGQRFMYWGAEGSYFDWFDNYGALVSGFGAPHYEPYFISGAYWTSSQYFEDFPCGVDNAYQMMLVTYDVYSYGFLAYQSRCLGMSVRLVSDE